MDKYFDEPARCGVAWRVGPVWEMMRIFMGGNISGGLLHIFEYIRWDISGIFVYLMSRVFTRVKSISVA